MPWELEDLDPTRPRITLRWRFLSCTQLPITVLLFFLARGRSAFECQPSVYKVAVPAVALAAVAVAGGDAGRPALRSGWALRAHLRQIGWRLTEALQQQTLRQRLQRPLSTTPLKRSRRWMWTQVSAQRDPSRS